MSIDTRFTPAIRNALLEQMQDISGRYAPDGGDRNQPDATQPGTPADDSVSLSADAQLVAAARNTAAGQEVFDTARVAELKLAVSSGMYSVDAERVAEKFQLFNRNL